VNSGSNPEERHARDEPIRIRVPGFVKEDVGLGDAVKRVTSAFGVRPCSPCEKRADYLNRKVIFSPRRYS
jgi:hypothetical protein